jgi:S-(hydroxymethyl)glutathione dehydrogenase/alcohol dehydrogenase
VGTVEEDVVSSAFDVIGKGGTVVITGLANPEKLTVHVSGGIMTLFEKTIKGTLFGSANPQYDIVKLLRLYDAGHLKLDELVTTRYTLDQVNDGYQDLRDGKNIRGVIIHEHQRGRGRPSPPPGWRSAAAAGPPGWGSRPGRAARP